MISVILAVRNGGLYLKQAVNSVLSQSYAQFEFLIVDDGSTDRTPEILNGLVSDDKRIRVITSKNSFGLTYSLNVALKESRGDYISRIDHDDLWHPEKLAHQMEFLLKHPYIGLLGTSYLEMDEDGSNLRKPVLPLCKTDAEIRRALYRFNPFFHSSIIARRDLVQKAGGYNERFLYAQDYELWVRLLSHAPAAIMPEVLCYRRMGEGNISVQKENLQRLNALKAKILWAKLNGVKFDLLVPLIRDLAVVFAPYELKKIVRRCLRSTK